MTETVARRSNHWLVLAVLLAVEVIPDIFRTMSNVTADMAVAAVMPDADEGADIEASRIPPQPSGVI